MVTQTNHIKSWYHHIIKNSTTIIININSTVFNTYKYLLHISLCIQSNGVHAFSHAHWNCISGAQSTFNYKLHFNYILQISYLPHINGRFRFTNQLKSTSLDCERKLEDPRRPRKNIHSPQMSRHALASVWPLLLIYHVQSLPCYFTITLFGDFPHDPSKTNSSQSLREPKQMWTWSNWTNVSLVTSVTHSTRVATTGALLTVITLCICHVDLCRTGMLENT